LLAAVLSSGSITYLPVDRTGRVDSEDVRRAVTSQTILISIMHANNEVGTIQPIKEIGTIAREHGIRFHTDAAQSVGKIPTKVNELGVDLLTIAGHKLYAPKGVGALYVRHGGPTHGADARDQGRHPLSLLCLTAVPARRGQDGQGHGCVGAH
jgi:cysteine desulfurase